MSIAVLWNGSNPAGLIFGYALIAVIAYLLGSINGAIITSKTFFKKDIRDFGSGNAGLTNFFRVFGKNGIVLVLAVDILKTVIPVFFGGWLIGLSGNWTDGSAFAAFFTMLGHAYPIYYGFKGGKTVMAAGTAIWFVDWRIGIIAIGAFLIIVALTKYVSLGSVIGGALYPLSMLFFFRTVELALIMATLSAALLIYRHRANIMRLINGTESKLKLSK